jgi:RimJ/RimL family protein N-acetyltransferase
MNSEIGPRISTDRIELRLLTPHAAPQLLRIAGDPALTRYLQWPPHTSVDDSLEFISDARRLWETETAFLPGIFDRERDQLVGSIALSSIDPVNRRAEVGTWIGVPYQRTGLNEHAKAAVFAYAFRDLGLTRLEFLVRSDNDSSLRSLRAMPGITHEGTLRARLRTHDTAHDAELFSLLARDWNAADWPSVTIAHAPSWR